MAYTQGTKNRVKIVATSKPPMTARPSGALWEYPIDMGTMPMIMAEAVMSTGRKRVFPASIAARSASPCSWSRSRA
jgi:hypothetical protein